MLFGSGAFVSVDHYIFILCVDCVLFKTIIEHEFKTINLSGVDQDKAMFRNTSILTSIVNKDSC